MPILVTCAACKTSLKAPDNSAGQQVRCPKCGGVVGVPAPAAGRTLPAAAPPEPSFFYTVNRQKVGPVPLSHLQRLASGGQLRAGDMVLREGTRAWVEAGAVAGLFSAAVRQAAPPAVVPPQPAHVPPPAPQAEVKPCPFCGESVLAVAKKCKHCGESIDVALRAAEEARRAAESARREAAPSNVVVNTVQEVSHSVVQEASLNVVAEVRRAAPPKSPGVAAMLELVGGGLCGTFGIGHFYAGSAGLGLLFMFGYWFVQFINFLLTGVFIGFVTLPLCWLIAMIVCPMSAVSAARSS